MRTANREAQITSRPRRSPWGGGGGEAQDFDDTNGDDMNYVARNGEAPSSCFALRRARIETPSARQFAVTSSSNSEEQGAVPRTTSSTMASASRTGDE